ncbi:LOG family protein, partial [Streptomyces decoyicus]
MSRALWQITAFVTWAQLGLHSKPCALLNTNGYYTPLLRFLEHA